MVRTTHPELLNVFGVGPIVAAIVLCAWTHSGRFRSEAAFAKLGGVAHIPASSGDDNTPPAEPLRDRQLNCALHTVVVTRRRCDQATQSYAARRRMEGKNDREIKRCLKRYIAPELSRLLEARTLDTT